MFFASEEFFRIAAEFRIKTQVTTFQLEEANAAPCEGRLIGAAVGDVGLETANRIQQDQTASPRTKSNA